MNNPTTHHPYRLATVVCLAVIAVVTASCSQTPEAAIETVEPTPVVHTIGSAEWTANRPALSSPELDTAPEWAAPPSGEAAWSPPASIEETEWKEVENQEGLWEDPTPQPERDPTPTATPPPTPAPVSDISTGSLEQGRLTVSADAAFDTGSSNLKAQGKQALEIAARQAEELPPHTIIEVHGYVDTVGETSSNDRLAAERALEASGHFEKHLQRDDLTIAVYAHGENDLLDPSCIGDCAANRVVVITSRSASE